MIFSRQIHILCGIITAEGVGTQEALILAEITTIRLLTSYTGWYMTVQAQHTAGTLAPQVVTSFCSGSSLNVSWALNDGPIHRAKTSSHKDSLWRDGVLTIKRP